MRPVQCAVDGGAADVEEFGQLGGGVFASGVKGDEVLLLLGAELRLLPAKSASSFGDLHALSRAQYG